jgi:ParB family transcriptional regulator, chromosome partitioning protein
MAGPGKTRSVVAQAGGAMESPRLALEPHQLDLCYERLRLRREEAEQRLLGSLAACGQQVPIVVVAMAEEPGRFRVIDGFRRLRALLRLGHDTVWATSWELTELDALLLSRGLRTASETAIEQGWLVAELSDRFHLAGEELARRLARSASWVSRRLALVRLLPESVQEEVRCGHIAPHAAMRHLVPLARAKPAECAELAAAVASHRLTSRELGEFVRLFRRASRLDRPRLLADPRLALRARQALGDSEAPSVALLWLREVESLAAALDRLRESLPALSAFERRQADGALAQTRHSLIALEQALSGDPVC